MTREGRIGSAALTVVLLVGCSGGGTDGGDSDARGTTQAPPTATAPSAPAEPTASRSQTVVYQTFADNGDTDVYAVNEDGSSTRSLAASGERAQFRGVSTDGWVIYDRFVSDTTSHLVAVHAESGETRPLDTSTAGKLFRGFTPDQRAIYEKSTATGTAIHSVRPDGTASAVLVDAPYTTAEFIAANNSGRVLYQTCERAPDPGAPPDCISAGLYSVAADGSDRRLLVAGQPRVALLTSDGRVVYEVTTGGQIDLFSIAANGDSTVTLADSPDDEVSPRLLADGRVVYARRVAGQWDVYLVNANGTGNRALLTSAEDEFVSDITPAGRILFVRRNASGQDNLYAIDADGTGLAVLGDSTDSESLRRVTADGRVIYSTRRTGTFTQDDLYSVKADGTDLRVLADSQEFEWFEDVAGDGRVIYMRCLAARGGPCEDPSAQSDLYSVRQDGAGASALATTGAFETFRAVTTNNRVIFQRQLDGQQNIDSVATDGSDPRPLAQTPVDERFQGLY